MKCTNKLHVEYIVEKTGWKRCKECRKEYMRQYNKTHGLNRQHKHNFGGNRETVLKRDNYQCVVCGMTDIEHRTKWDRAITIDHIDNKGRYSKEKNNSLDNLQTLCLSCHGKKDHRGSIKP